VSRARKATYADLMKVPDTTVAEIVDAVALDTTRWFTR
jgi:hypothetical protein